MVNATLNETVPTTELADTVHRPDPARPVVDIVIPVYNEAAVLAASVHRVCEYLRTSFPFSAQVTIADNASTDATWQIAGALAATEPNVRLVHLAEKGRGRALREAWSSSTATVVAYMDVDLSTDLDALLPLVAPLLSGHSDVAIGSRLASGSRTVRGPKREVISRCYNGVIRLCFRNRFRDAQCGFKAVSADLAQALLPAVSDQEWFFDTELLLLAERNGLRIAEVPVDWVDDPDSRVHIVRTATDDLKGLARLAWGFWRGRGVVDLGDARRTPPPSGTGGQLVTFAAVGTVSTIVTLTLFVLLRTSLGSIAAMVVALSVAAVANLAANRRWTFGRRGVDGRRAEWLRAGGVHLVGLAIATGAIVVAHAIDGGSLTTELVLISLAFVAATALRVVLLPTWIFREAEPS